MSPTLSIRLLGTVDLRLDGKPLPPLRSAREESLLAYLLLHADAPQPRERVAFLLWPDSSEAQARTNLRHVLHDLRRELPDADRFLDVETRTVQWKRDAPFWLDVAAFDAAIERGNRGDERIDLLKQAVELYRADLLEACYDEWITDHRTRLRQRCVAALDELATALDQRGSHAEAIPYAERLLQLEPLREDTYRLLMRLHDARGDRARALQVYHTCVSVLQREVGVGPSQATREAYEALLRDDRDGHRAASGDRRSRADPQPVPRLVGRADEWARLTSIWRTVEAGQPGVLLITGEPGVGKTRLVEELAAWCTRRKAVAVMARSYAAEGGLAYAALATWLRAGEIDRNLTRIDRAHVTQLSRLLPELVSRIADLGHPPALPEAEQRRRLFEAATSAITSASAPLLLMADDIQWCDQETLRFVHYLLRHAPKSPLLIAATCRLGEMQQRQEVVDLITALRSQGTLTELELSHLTREATADLVAVLRAESLDAAQADALFRETEGNPLFVIEAVHAGWRSGERPADALTPRVHAVIEARLGQLSQATREMVGVAATLGRDFTADVLAIAADKSADTVAATLDELWRARIVRDHVAGVYDFSHDKIREVAYLAMSPPRRRQNHLRAAQALKRVRIRDLDRVSAQIAGHYDHAGVPEEAIAWYEAAAEASERMYASQESVRCLTRARELVATAPNAPERNARELAILTAMLTPLANVEGFGSKRLADVQQRIIGLARALAVDAPPQVLRSLAVSSLSRDNFDAALHCGEQLQARARTDADDALLIESAYVLGIAAFWKGELSLARHHFEAAVSGYRPDRRRSHLLRFWLDPQVICLSRLANTLWFLGDAVSACRARDDALALGAEINHAPTFQTALVFASLLAVDMNDAPRLREYVATLIAGQTEYDARPTRNATEAFRGYVRVLDGDAAAGIAGLRAALDDLREGGHAPGQRGVTARLLMSALEISGDTRDRLDAAELTLGMGGAASLWESEAHRVRAECLAGLGASEEEIVAAFERAIAVAQRQGARAFEERAAASFAQLRPGPPRRASAGTL